MSNQRSTVVFADDEMFDQDFALDPTQDELGVEPEDVMEYSEVETQKKRRGPTNPYHMNRHKVRMFHFKDARLYDQELNDPQYGTGWEVQSWYARKKYIDWIHSVRKIAGWEGFRRTPREIFEAVEDEDGNKYIIHKLVPYRVPGLPLGKIVVLSVRQMTDDGSVVIRKGSKKGPKMLVPKRDAGRNTNNSRNMTAQSRVKGARPDDEDFRGKMFTKKMGKEIEQLRHQMKLTQAELGKLINVDANTIRDIELGDIVPFNSENVMVKALARVLGLPSIKFQE